MRTYYCTTRFYSNHSIIQTVKINTHQYLDVGIKLRVIPTLVCVPIWTVQLLYPLKPRWPFFLLSCVTIFMGSTCIFYCVFSIKFHLKIHVCSQINFPRTSSFIFYSLPVHSICSKMFIYHESGIFLYQHYWSWCKSKCLQALVHLVLLSVRMHLGSRVVCFVATWLFIRW